jgi:hypothetical protein
VVCQAQEARYVINTPDDHDSIQVLDLREGLQVEVVPDAYDCEDCEEDVDDLEQLVMGMSDWACCLQSYRDESTGRLRVLVSAAQFV